MKISTNVVLPLLRQLLASKLRRISHYPDPINLIFIIFAAKSPHRVRRAQLPPLLVVHSHGPRKHTATPPLAATPVFRRFGASMLKVRAVSSPFIRGSAESRSRPSGNALFAVWLQFRDHAAMLTITARHDVSAPPNGIRTPFPRHSSADRQNRAAFRPAPARFSFSPSFSRSHRHAFHAVRRIFNVHFHDRSPTSSFLDHPTPVCRCYRDA